jgi:cytochrome c oxidase assembly protein subunit 15
LRGIQQDGDTVDYIIDCRRFVCATTVPRKIWSNNPVRQRFRCTSELFARERETMERDERWSCAEASDVEHRGFSGLADRDFGREDLVDDCADDNGEGDNDERFHVAMVPVGWRNLALIVGYPFGMAAVPRTRVRVFSIVAWSTLAFNVLVILGGTVVRATGSGDGCGATWPKCGDQFIPPNQTVETLIEYAHRASSVLAGVGVAVVFVLALWVFEKGHIVRKAATVAGALLVVEALLGAGLVLFEWVDADVSMGRVIAVPLHLTNTFLLLGALTTTAWWGSGFDAPHAENSRRELQWLVIGAVVLIILGTTGALNALADTVFPSDSVTGDLAEKFGPTAPALSQLRIVHPILAVIGGIVVAWIATSRARRGSERTRSLATLFTFVVLSQMFIGIANIFFLTPLSLQIIHLMVADVLWIGFIAFGASLLGDPVRATAQTAVPA